MRLVFLGVRSSCYLLKGSSSGSFRRFHPPSVSSCSPFLPLSASRLFARSFPFPSSVRHFSSSHPSTVSDSESGEGEQVGAVMGNSGILAHEDQLRACVKIFATVSSPNYLMPWQNKSLAETSGSGFVVKGNKIITNAHVVADEKHVTVRKLGSPLKYTASVQAISHDCDLALLTVEDESFFQDVPPLEFGGLPQLQEEIAVVGYPMGGDNISITHGVVSRVEPQQYVHGGCNLLAIQIDAAINPGNSGGPSLADGKVVGVAFQNLQGANNIGFVIPVSVIKHFLKETELRQEMVTSFCLLGVSCQSTENLNLQRFLGIDQCTAITSPGNTGVLVNEVAPVASAFGVLQERDVILEVDGVPISCDGTVHFRGSERISFDYLVTAKHQGEECLLTILRNREVMEVSVKMSPLPQLVPLHQFNQPPSYYIFGGLVFVPLTTSYLDEVDKAWYSTASYRELFDLSFKGKMEHKDQQVVVLSQVLSHQLNQGYQNYVNTRVLKVNGNKVLNISHLQQLIDAAVQEARGNVELEMNDSRLIVLDVASAGATNKQLLALHRIPSDRSADLALN